MAAAMSVGPPAAGIDPPPVGVGWAKIVGAVKFGPDAVALPPPSPTGAVAGPPTRPPPPAAPVEALPPAGANTATGPNPRAVGGLVTAANRLFGVTRAASAGDADEVATLGVCIAAGADDGVPGDAAVLAAASMPAATAAVITVFCLAFEIVGPCLLMMCSL